MEKEIRITINKDGAYRVKIHNFSGKELVNSVGVLLKSAYDSAIKADCESEFKNYMNGIIKSVYNKRFTTTKSHSAESDDLKLVSDFIKAYADKYGISDKEIGKIIDDAQKTATMLRKLLEGVEDEEDA